MFGIFDVFSVGSLMAALTAHAQAAATGDQAMKLIVPMIALIIVAIVLVCIVIYMSNKNKKKNGRNIDFKGFDDDEFK